jgi:aspartate-semialdehyde dehydrogenase
LDKIQARAVVSKFRKKSLVVDCSGAFRFAPHVHHIIPEINGHVLTEPTGIVANPSPITIQLGLVLFPLHEKFRLKHMHVVALDAVSDLGRDALDELDYEYEFLAVGEPVEKAYDSVFPYTIGSNLIPQIGDFVHQGYTEEETLLPKEIADIFGQDDILVSATYIWVPVRRTISAVVYIDFDEKISATEAKKVLKSAKGVKLMSHDDEYPTPECVVGTDDVFVGRLRKDVVFPNGLAMWISADNLRKGSALNAVQIAELL